MGRKPENQEAGVGPRQKHCLRLPGSSSQSLNSAISSSGSWGHLRHQVSQVSSSSESEGTRLLCAVMRSVSWSSVHGFLLQSHLGHLSQMQNCGPCLRVLLNPNDWEWGLGLDISGNCPLMTPRQPDVLESVSADIGSPFYVETIHEKAESIVCLKPRKPPSRQHSFSNL